MFHSSAPERIVPSLVRENLADHPFGDRLIHAPVCESSNDVLWVEIERGAGMGTVVSADQQTRGRGRTGRRWESPAGKDLLVSVAAPYDESYPPGSLALWGAVAVADFLIRQGKIPVELKWPNDLIVGGRKLGGVMAETRSGQSLAVVGIGINVLSADRERPEELRHSAVSLREIDNRDWDRSLLLAGLLNALAGWWDRLHAEGWGAVYGRWRELCSTIGQTVRAQSRNQTLVGYVRDIDSSGRLILESLEGDEIILSAAEITSLVALEDGSHNESSSMSRKEKENAG